MPLYNVQWSPLGRLRSAVSLRELAFRGPAEVHAQERTRLMGVKGGFPDSAAALAILTSKLPSRRMNTLNPGGRAR